DLFFDNPQVQAGEKSTILMTPDIANVAFSSTGDQSPQIELGVSDAVDYAFTLSGVKVPSGSALNIALPVGAGQLTLSNAPGGSYNLLVDRFDEQAELNFKHDGIELESGDPATLQYGPWSGKDQPMS